MQKIIFFALLGVLFSLNSVYASFDTDQFAKNFYKNIQQQVEVNEKVQITERVTATTSLPQPLVRKILHGALSLEDQKDILAWCNEPTNTLFFASNCQEELERILRFELDIQKLDTALGLDLEASEVWANGTLKDSPFDLVVDLNIIDAILFGTEAKIPLARFKDFDEASSMQVQPGQRIAGGPERGGEGENTQTPSDFPDSPRETPEDLFDPNPISPLAEIQYPSQTETQLQCIDPRTFVFIDVSPQSVPDPTALPEDNSQGAVPEGDDQESSGDTWDGQENPLLSQELQQQNTCENPLYGGYYCRDNLGAQGGSSSDSCDPSQGVCKKCFGESNSVIRFCITTEFKSSEHSLFASTWVENSIRGYIEAALDVYESLLGATPLTPTQQQSQGGFLTHLWDMVSGPGQILYVAGKIPDMWIHEAKQKSFEQADLIQEWDRIQHFTKAAYDVNRETKEENTVLAFSEAENKRSWENIRNSESYKKYEKEFSDEALALYYKNVHQNLKNFHNIFQTRFAQSLETFPFEEVRGANEVCRTP